MTGMSPESSEGAGPLPVDMAVHGGAWLWVPLFFYTGSYSGLLLQSFLGIAAAVRIL